MKVTALIMTYNHERFIRQALESALGQEVDFAYEIVISEDRSTDGTRDIVLEYAQRFPETVRLVLSEHNLRSNEVVARGFRAAKGEYVALLDGDDYWTSPRKLAKQVAFLDDHPGCTICFHNAEVRTEGGGQEPRLWTPPGHPTISTLEDIWMGNFIATASTMYRNGVVDAIPAWYSPMFPITDWPLHILHAARGSIGYIDEVMSVYRYHEGGLYSRRSEDEKLDATARFYRAMNANLGYRHDRLVKRAHARYFFDWAREYARRGDFKRARSCLVRSITGGGIRPSIPLSQYARLARRVTASDRVQEHAAHRARIRPVPADEARPLWSVMIPSYNCGDYLRVCLESVVAQDPGPDRMQIEVVDDHSTRDDPQSTVETIGRGRVGFFRQPRNLGVVGNLHTCLERARGRLVHLLHADDMVHPGFYDAMERAFDQSAVGAAFCRHHFIDEAGRLLSVSPLEQASSGVLDDGLERLASEQRIMTPSIVVRREVYERLGGFDRRLLCSEDWEMWVRIASRYPVWYEVEPLASYRMHSDSNTGRHIRTGENVRDMRQAIEIFQDYLPPHLRRMVVDTARETYALSALRIAEGLIEKRDRWGALAQTREAFKLSLSRRVIRRALRLLSRGSRASWAGQR